MTDWEKAVVMAYTGVVTLNGDKLAIFRKYINEKMGSPVFTHELLSKDMMRQIKEAARADFLAICAKEE